MSRDGEKADAVNCPDSSEESRLWWQGLTGYQWLVLFITWLGWMFDVMDIILFAYLKTPCCMDLLGPAPTDPALLKEWNGAVAGWAGAVLGVGLAGWAAGGIIFGILGDKIGRTRTMMLTILVYSIFTGLSAFAHNVWQLAFFRFLTGLGVGGEWAAGASLLAETFPRRSRVWAACVLQCGGSIGIILAALIAHVTVLKPQDYVFLFDWLPSALTDFVGSQRWRYAFLVGVLPAFLTVWVRLGLHEPERWQSATQAHAREEFGSVPELFSPRFRRYTVTGVLLAVAGVFGIWGANHWTPELLTKVAAQNKTTILNLQAVAQVLGLLFCAPLAIYWGRRAAFAFYFLGSLLATPAAFHFTVSETTAFALIPVMGFFAGGMFSGYIIYFPELYPTRLRATGAGFCYNVARLAAAPAPLIMGLLQQQMSLQWSATVIALIYIVGLAALPFAEETKGKPLPED